MDYDLKQLKQSGLPQQQLDRIALLFRTKDAMPFQTNCVGVAFYVVGLLPEPTYTEPWLIPGLSERLERIAKTKLGAGDLAVWQGNSSLTSVVHAGVVVSKTPKRIFQTNQCWPDAVELMICPPESRTGAKLIYYRVRTNHGKTRGAG
jgi:hypothetical protein